MLFLQFSISALVDATHKFDEKIASNTYLFTLHCAPDCQFCDEMMDIMEDVADYFEDYEDELVIGHANCRIKPEICANHKITEHPTLLLWKGGRKVGEYRGPRNAIVVTEWLKVKVGLDQIKSDIKQEI
ncbi:Protein_disulfide isomerase PDI3 [Hexamita inflata]|uniref:Protein disulfide isomerase PDI3 n=1 Tax=Hexamita inflata TaxID=28002 RepID=A0AA86R731_9EUKA|nr:Protein disulfide isomerase PDI3 [Hexamita inflata]CAI9969893.1 Protein disulfide isomerase PDI3 [Hexamita inflata]